jgi:hypothetical protein
MLTLLFLLSLPFWGRLFKEEPRPEVSRNRTGPDWEQDIPWVLGSEACDGQG